MSMRPDAPLPARPSVVGPDVDIAVDVDEVVSMAAVAPPPAEGHLDLDHIERDLADVEAALRRLDSGEYWTDEVTGAPLPDEHLVDHPTARRLVGR